MNPHGLTDEEFEYWRHETFSGALWELNKAWEEMKFVIVESLPKWAKSWAGYKGKPRT